MTKTLKVLLVLGLLSSELSANDSGYTVQDYPQQDYALVSEDPNIQVPLCCPQGEIFRLHRCVPTAGNHTWRPKLNSEPRASFYYENGTPQCGLRHQAFIRQEEVTLTEATMRIPPFIQIEPLEEYCVTRFEEKKGDNDLTPVTMIVTCLVTVNTPPSGPLVLTLCSVALVLLLITVVAHCLVPKLRHLQGSYQIYLLVSLLMYDVLVYPVSVVNIEAAPVTCSALHAIKYFCFCAYLSWLLIICGDVARVLHCRSCESSTKRHILYNLAAWMVAGLVAVGGVFGMMYNGVLNPQEGVCAIGLELYMGFILFEGLVLVINFVMLLYATAKLRGAVNDQLSDLKPSDAGKCMRLAWSFWFISLFHLIFDVAVSQKMAHTIYYWQFLVLEALSMFALLVYNRRCVWSGVRGRLCGSHHRVVDPSVRYSVAESVTNEKAKLAAQAL